MGLIHWWPLNGDLKDKIGISSIRSGTYVNNANGKIGSCLKNNASGIQTSVPLASEWSHWKHSVSMSCWIKINYNECNEQLKKCSFSSQAKNPTGLIIGQASYGGLGIYWDTSNAMYDGTSVISNLTSIRVRGYTRGNSSTASTSPYTLEYDTWHHLTLVADYNKKVLRFYVNGVQVGSDTNYSSIPEMTDVRYFGFGRTEVSGGNGPGAAIPMSINDVRLYDHALSLAEVQEIAKGLVLHYNFNQLYTKNICNWRNTSTCVATGWSGNVKYENEILTLTATNGWRSFMWDIGDSNIGKPITFSYEYRLVDTSNAGYIFVQNHTASGYGSSIQDLSLDTPEWISKSVTVNSANKYIGFNVRGTDNTGLDLIMQVRNIKIALNSYDTHYSEYNELPLRCPDDSGNNNNGTYYQINASNDVKRGSFTPSFDGNVSYIESPNFKPNLPNEDYTIAFWIKPSENKIRDVIYGNHANSTHSFSIERYTSNQLRIYYNGDTPGYINAATMLANEWTHIAIIKKGNVIQVWKNGAKVSDATYSLSTLTCSNAFYKIGSDYRAAVGTNEATRLKGLIDDFRIYVTALDEKAIKDLYEPAIYITNQDSFMANEFIEDSEIEMTNTATVKSVNFIEEINSNYEILEYIASTGTQYINTNYVPTTNFKIELDMMWTGSTVNQFESFAGFMHADTNPRAGLHKYNSILMFGGNSTTSSTVKPVKNQRIIYTGDFISGNQKLYKNNILITSTTTSFDFSANAQEVYIFGRNASTKNLATMRLYRGNIYNEIGELIRNLIPVRRKNDSVLGLYDTITQTFYANSGTGTFTAGPTLSNDKISMYASSNISAKEFIEI